MVLPFLIHIPLLVFIALLLRKKYRESPLLKFYWWALGWKALAGISIGLIYIYHYGSAGDTIAFHAHSAKLTDVFFENPGEFFRIIFSDTLSAESQKAIELPHEPRVLYFVKILSLLNLITFKNYWISGLYLSLFSFLGAWILANTIIKIFKTSLPATALSFLFFPSFVFWTSGILKEAFVVGSISFIIALSLQYIHLKRKINLIEIFLLLILTYFSWKIKFYYILIVLPVLIAYYLVILLSEKIPPIKKKSLPYNLTLTAIVALLALSAVLIHPGLSISYLSGVLYNNYVIILETSKGIGKAAYEFENFGPEPLKIILNTPKALFIGLFRPFIWEIQLNFSLLTGIENLLLLVLAFLKIFQLIKSPKKLSIETTALLIYVCMTAAIMSLIAPNWGTLVRYKAAFLPFWVLFLSVNNPLFNYIEKLLFKNKEEPS